MSTSGRASTFPRWLLRLTRAKQLLARIKIKVKTWLGSCEGVVDRWAFVEDEQLGIVV